MINIHPNPYINAVIIIVSFFILGKIFQFISEKVFMRLAKKTKTDIDDHIVEGTRTPITILLFMIGVHLGIKTLNFGSASTFVANFIATFEILVIAFIIIRIVVIIINGWGREWTSKTESKADDQLLDFAIKIVYVIGWSMGLLYALTVWGVQIGPLLASLGVMGIAVAFALQESLGNIFGGVSMMLDRSVHTGDVIELEDGVSGEVVDIGLRATKIRSWNNEILILPNGSLANSRIKNIVLPEPKVRVVLPFGVEYGSNIEKVKKIVMQVIPKAPGYIPEPEPVVRFLEMANSSLNFKAYFWVDKYSIRFAAIDEGNTLIYNALGKAGIGIPFPQMDVHIKDKAQNKVKTQKKK